jgi:alpha-galactosidase
MSPIAALPPLGWNSWNRFGPEIHEDAVLAQAEALVRLGLAGLGYRYVVIDDCWSLKQRDAQGNLVADPAKFPSGIAALAGKVHALGLKLGIYSDAAELTCAGHLGSFGHEERDAALWASWGIDFLKYDYCHAPVDQATAIQRYTRMGRALRATGREILYSICEWGDRNPQLWAREAGGAMWRASGDLFDSWTDQWVPGNPGFYGRGVDQAFDLADRLAPYGGPGGWNDLDMLVVGLRGKGQGHIKSGGLRAHEYRAHMSLWIMACSPLMIGCDLREADAETLALLGNPEALALNQDPLGRPARRVATRGGLEAWTKPLQDGGLGLMLVNRGNAGADFSVSAGELGLKDAPKALRDLWERKDESGFGARLERRVQPHEALLYRVSPP